MASRITVVSVDGDTQAYNVDNYKYAGAGDLILIKDGVETIIEKDFIEKVKIGLPTSESMQINS